MRLYLAGRYTRKLELRGYADTLTAAGFTVTSRWLMEPEDPNVHLRDVPISRLQDIAKIDLFDIDTADAVLFFAEDPDHQPPRGGRHVEFGYAIGRGKPVYVIGSFENVFHYLSVTHHVDSFDAFMQAVKPLPKFTSQL